jgi:glycosyltransferase involved in cell wall biosynthesis
LGETRNVGIRAARGEYILLHIDADDVWEPHIKDFVAVFHRIEKCLGRDIYLQGQQIGIGRKSFLLERGPYRNTFVEDRDMWHRLASEKAYLLLEHRVFRKRLPLRVRKKIYKTLWIKSYNHMLYDLRRNSWPREYVINALTGPFRKGREARSIVHKFVRMVLILPTYVISRFKEPLEMPPSMPSHSEYVEYRERTKGTYAEIMTRHNCDPDLSFLEADAQRIFSVAS